MTQAKIYYGTAFPNGSAVFLARIVGEYSEVLKRSDLSSGSYTATLLDPVLPDRSASVTGHENVSLDLDEVFFNALQTDGSWDVDAQGYNFRHIPEIGEHPLFTLPRRLYEMDYTFHFTDTARPPVRVKFRVYTR